MNSQVVRLSDYERRRRRDRGPAVERGAYLAALVLVALVASFVGFSVGFISAVGVRLP